MATVKQQADEQGRVALGNDFANQTVVVEHMGDGELRISRVKPRPQRFTLEYLLADVVPDQLHPETHTDPAVGKEVI